jgi:hypothetical protein
LRIVGQEAGIDCNAIAKAMEESIASGSSRDKEPVDTLEDTTGRSKINADTVSGKG